MRTSTTSALVGVVAISAGWQRAHNSSELVRRWRPSVLDRRLAGPLSVRDSGPAPGDRVTLVILHGLGTTGEYFGSFYDGLAAERRVVIVDLLGFGGSIDMRRSSFGLDDHVEALDEALAALGLDDQPLVLAAHSMASALAVTWAHRTPERTAHVVLWGPPVYPLGAAAQSVSKEYGLMGRLLALDPIWARRACRVNCMNHDVSGRVMALLAPGWPTGVSSQASRHTWEAYHGSLTALILEFDWSDVLGSIDGLTVIRGSNDPIGDRGFLAVAADEAEIIEVPGADHHVALERPDLLVEALDTWSSGPP